MWASDTAPRSTVSNATMSRPKVSRRFIAALACLGLAYALSWGELWFSMHLAGSSRGASSLLAALTSRALVGILILCVAEGSAWARAIVIALGVASAVATLPLLPSAPARASALEQRPRGKRCALRG
jgi:hypothetical protein